MEFPCDIVRVVEGKKVELRVQVVGQPEPKLTWYHDGEEVVTSYSTDLGLDGSLTIPCSEHSHSGVYQLVALNNSGRAERQLKLVVRKEEPSQPQQSNSKLPLSPVSVLDFEEYVSDGHKNDDAIFQEQFTVRFSILSCLYITVPFFTHRSWMLMLTIPQQLVVILTMYCSTDLLTSQSVSPVMYL